MSDTTKPERTLLLVGLGRIAKVQTRVLEGLEGVKVVGGVDVEHQGEWWFRDGAIPIYSDLKKALEKHQPDTVIVSSPSASHVAMCHKVIDLDPRVEILVEKPLSVGGTDAQELLRRAKEIGTKLSVLYHMAFAPEVLWALDEVDSEGFKQRGTLQGFSSEFLDPYVNGPEMALTSLENSWVDSGSNALSVLGQFMALEEVSSLEEDVEYFSTFRARLAYRYRGEHGEGGVFTSWSATDPSQSTTLYFDDDVKVVMDHTSVSGRVVQRGVVTKSFSNGGLVPRRESHYQNLYRAWIDEGAEGLDVVDTEHLQRLLAGPAN